MVLQKLNYRRFLVSWLTGHIAGLGMIRNINLQEKGLEILKILCNINVTQGSHAEAESCALKLHVRKMYVFVFNHSATSPSPWHYCKTCQYMHLQP